MVCPRVTIKKKNSKNTVKNTIKGKKVTQENICLMQKKAVKED